MRTGTRFPAVVLPGGLGAGRPGTILAPPPLSRCRGIGGGARGFSKLPSWFWGKRGEAGGLRTDVYPPGVAAPGTVNPSGLSPVGCASLGLA